MLFSTSIIFPQKKRTRCRDFCAASFRLFVFCCWLRSWEWGWVYVMLYVCKYTSVRFWVSPKWQLFGDGDTVVEPDSCSLCFWSPGAVQDVHLQLVFIDVGSNSSFKPQSAARTILPYWASFFAMNKELRVNPSKQPRIKDRPEQIRGQTGFPKSFFSFGRKKNAKCVNIWWAHHLMRPQTLLYQRSLKATGEMFPVMFS